MKRFDWNTVVEWGYVIFILLMVVLLIVVIIAQIRTDINKDELNDFILLLHTGR